MDIIIVQEIYFLSDPYGRFEATVKITIIDPENILKTSSSGKHVLFGKLKK